jgi:hypothetical protein
MTDAEIESLRDFFAAWFNQDWVDEYSEPADVVADFIEVVNDADRLFDLGRNIRAYAVAHPSDAALNDLLLHDLGCYYGPTADKVSARAWMEEVAIAFEHAARGIKR